VGGGGRAGKVRSGQKNGRWVKGPVAGGRGITILVCGLQEDLGRRRVLFRSEGSTGKGTTKRWK